MLQSEEKNCPSNFQYEIQNLCVIDREKEREREKESNRDREKERKMREERESVSWDLGEGVRRVLYSVYKGEWEKGRGGREILC